MKVVQPSVELISHTPEPEMLIEAAGRTCYKSDRVKCPACGGSGCVECGEEGYTNRIITEKTAADFIAMITKRGHESVIEHAVATVRIVCDRGVTHELVRHRLASYSQESTRYCNYGKDKYGKEISVIEPPGLTKVQYDTWHSMMVYAEEHYLCLLEDNASPQIARSVLPNSLKTEIVTTFNFREWGHFFRLRMGKAAHPQMRQIAVMAWELLCGLSTACFFTPYLEASAQDVIEDIPGDMVIQRGKNGPLRMWCYE